MGRSTVAIASLCLALLLSAEPAHARTAVAPTVLSSAPATGDEVALTFDDGPSAYTPALLSELHRLHVHATFFLVGKQVTQYPADLRAEIAAGDELGNHTYSHADLQWLPNDEVDAQLRITQQIIHHAAGLTPVWFRPPYGAVDLRIAGLAAALGLRTITWSVDPQDWALPGTSLIVWRVTSAARPGAVILLHDGGGDRSETIAAVSEIVPILRSRGYRFVTLSQLFRLTSPLRHVKAIGRRGA